MSLPKDIVFESLPVNMVRISEFDSLQNMQKVKKSKKEILFSAENCDARKVIENIQPNFVVNSEYHKLGDHGHQLNSGIDLPTFRFMKDKGIFFCVDIGKLYIFMQSKRSNPIFARIKQNILLAKKAGTTIVYISGSKMLSDAQKNAIIESLQ